MRFYAPFITEATLQVTMALRSERAMVGRRQKYRGHRQYTGGFIILQTPASRNPLTTGPQSKALRNGPYVEQLSEESLPDFPIFLVEFKGTSKDEVCGPTRKGGLVLKRQFDAGPERPELEGQHADMDETSAISVYDFD